MKYLFVFEDNKGSANTNITLKLAREMSKSNEIYGCFCFAESVHDEEAEAFFTDILKIGNYNDELYYELDDYGWKAKSVNQKISFLLFHPFIMRRYVVHRLKHGKKLSDYRDSLRSFVKQYDIECIIGFTNPYSIAILVSALDVSCKKAIFQMDPYSTYFDLSMSRAVKRGIIERDILGKIDKIFTTRLIIRDLNGKGILCENDSKTVEIEFPLINVNPETQERNAKSIIKKKIGHKYFLHAGTLIEKIRNPRILVSIFEKLPNNYILVVAGRGSNLIRKYDNKIRERVIDLGIVSQCDAIRLKNEADFLICFNNLTYNMIPSKLFECIDSGKPFLNICQLMNCPSIPYVEDYENACIIHADRNIKPCDIEKLMAFVESKMGYVIEHTDIVDRYKKCTIEYVSKTIELQLE